MEALKTNKHTEPNDHCIPCLTFNRCDELCLTFKRQNSKKKIVNEKWQLLLLKKT